MDVAYPPEAAPLQRNGPAVGILDVEVLDAEVFHKGQQDSDIAPIARLAFALLAGVGSVRSLGERLGLGNTLRTQWAVQVSLDLAHPIPSGFSMANENKLRWGHRWSVIWRRSTERQEHVKTHQG